MYSNSERRSGQKEAILDATLVADRTGRGLGVAIGGIRLHRVTRERCGNAAIVQTAVGQATLQGLCHRGEQVIAGDTMIAADRVCAAQDICSRRILCARAKLAVCKGPASRGVSGDCAKKARVVYVSEEPETRIWIAV